MPAFYFEVYSGRPAVDGGIIEPRKAVRRVGTVRFAVTSASPSSTAPTFISAVRDALDKHPVFNQYKITPQHLVDAISNINDSSAGAYSQRIGKHVYGYRIGFDNNFVDAESNAVYRDFK